MQGGQVEGFSKVFCLLDPSLYLAFKPKWRGVKEMGLVLNVGLQQYGRGGRKVHASFIHYSFPFCPVQCPSDHPSRAMPGHITGLGAFKSFKTFEMIQHYTCISHVLLKPGVAKAKPVRGLGLLGLKHSPELSWAEPVRRNLSLLRRAICTTAVSSLTCRS